MWLVSINGHYRFSVERILSVMVEDVGRLPRRFGRFCWSAHGWPGRQPQACIELSLSCTVVFLEILSSAYVAGWSQLRAAVTCGKSGYNWINTYFYVLCETFRAIL